MKEIPKNTESSGRRNAIDQNPFTAIKDNKELVPEGVFKEKDGFERMLWEIADVGRGAFWDDPEEHISQEILRGRIKYAGGVVRKVGRLVMIQNRSEVYAFIHRVTERLNSLPYAMSYLNSLKRSGLFKKNFDFIDASGSVRNYKDYLGSMKSVRMEGINEDVPRLSTEKDIGKLVPGKSGVNRYYKILSATRDRENED